MRRNTPFANYAPSLLLSLPNAHPEQPLKSNWSGSRGFGARHYLDDAPFSLWDNEKQDFRSATQQEINWIFFKHSATYVAFDWPEIVIRTEMPPNPLPLTVGCVGTTFLPPPSAQNPDGD